MRPCDKVRILLLLSLCSLHISFCNKIVGGEEVIEGNFQFMTALSLKINAAPYCGGTLIATDYVLSAAHCTAPKYVFIGCVNYKSSRCDRIKVESTFLHPLYDKDSFRFDFMLIKLEAESKYEPIGSIMGDDFGDDLELQSVVTMGWGVLQEDGPTTDTLNQVELNVLSAESCERAYSSTGLIVYNDQICASSFAKDSCYGDSGGPLLLDCGTNETLVGVVSWGIGCATRYPGVYSRLSSAIDWIDSVVPHSTVKATEGCVSVPQEEESITPYPSPYPTQFPTGYPSKLDEKPWWCIFIFC